MYNNYGLELKAAGRIREAEKSYLVSGKLVVQLSSIKYHGCVCVRMSVCICGCACVYVDTCVRMCLYICTLM